MQLPASEILFEDADRLNLEVLEVKIDSKEIYDQMAEYLRRAKNALKVLDAKRQEEVRPFLEAQREVQSRYKPYIEKLESTIRLIDKAMIEWVRYQEKLRFEEQRRLELKARAEEEKKRKELEERAKKWEERGNEAKAEILREEAEQVIVPVLTVETVKQPEGQMVRTTWKGRVVDVKKIPYEYLLVFSEIVQGKVDRFAASTKGTIPIAGIEFYEEKKIITRG